MQLLQVQYTSLAMQYSIAKQSFNILNMYLSLDELRHQIQLELHPSDFYHVRLTPWGKYKLNARLTV